MRRADQSRPERVDRLRGVIARASRPAQGPRPDGHHQGPREHHTHQRGAHLHPHPETARTGHGHRLRRLHPVHRRPRRRSRHRLLALQHPGDERRVPHRPARRRDRGRPPQGGLPQVDRRGRGHPAVTGRGGGRRGQRPRHAGHGGARYRVQRQARGEGEGGHGHLGPLPGRDPVHHGDPAPARRGGRRSRSRIRGRGADRRSRARRPSERLHHSWWKNWPRGPSTRSKVWAPKKSRCACIRLAGSRSDRIPSK